MSEEFKFSDPGEGLQEAEVLEIHVSEGDHVNDGDTVLTVETDKAATDIPAPFSGTVEKVHLKTGDVVRVDDVLFTYAPDDGAKPEKETEKGADEDEASAEEEEGADKSGKSADEEEKGAEDEKKENREGSKERPRDDEEGTAGAEESAVDEETSEAAQRTEDRAERDESEKREATSSSSEREGRRSPVPASPSTRRIARERGVDLHDVQPSGPQGRVTTEDVEAAAEGEAPAAEGEKKGGRKEAAAAPSSLPDFSQWGETEREPLRSIRRITAERMSQSWQTVPHVYHQDVADVTELERFRRDYEASAQVNGGKFTLTILVMKALVFALKQFPRFNASLDTENQEIVLKRYYNIGVAAATERGLLVPVIRDVDKKNLIELTESVTDTVEKARNGELGREDMEGASMTLTNPGPLGGTSLTPLINLPEVAILGLGQARLEPVVHGDLEDYGIKPRLLLPLSLGFDHRVNDGADAANFVTTLIGALEDPQALLLKI